MTMSLTRQDGQTTMFKAYAISQYRPIEYYLQFLLIGEVLEAGGETYGAASLLERLAHLERAEGE